MTIPVILAGGSGTRLWPMSRRQRPKQFLPLITERTLFQETALRAARVPDAQPPIVVCSGAHCDLVLQQLEDAGIPPQAVVLEPEGRNTAPAVAVAALLARRQASTSEAPLLLVLPADHVIRGEAHFLHAAEQAAAAGRAGKLVTFGIVPHRAETGYGYIRSGRDRGRWFDVEQFVEKPDAETARKYVTSGHYLWNSGMFMLAADTYLGELRRHAPQIAAACERAVAESVTEGHTVRLGKAFLDCPSDSIDYAVMEKTASAAVVPLDAGWSDVGSWSALLEVLAADGDGNVIRGDVLARGCRNTYLFSSSRLVTALGLEDCVVIETPDAVLVMSQSRAQELKQIVDALSRSEEGGGGSPPNRKTLL